MKGPAPSTGHQDRWSAPGPRSMSSLPHTCLPVLRKSTGLNITDKPCQATLITPQFPASGTSSSSKFSSPLKFQLLHSLPLPFSRILFPSHLPKPWRQHCRQAAGTWIEQKSEEIGTEVRPGARTGTSPTWESGRRSDSPSSTCPLSSCSLDP